MAKKSNTGPQNAAQAKIQAELSKLHGGDLAFVWVPVANSMSNNIDALRESFKQGYRCIYVSLSKDAGELLRVYKHAGLDTTRIVFIDGVARMYSSAQVSDPNVVYVTGPLATEEILETITKATDEHPGEKNLVYFDSLTSILLYNTPEKTEAFVQEFAKLLKKLNAVGIGISVSVGAYDTRLIEQLKKISSRIIDLTKETK